MRTRPVGPAAAGFTLIEVMISMFFLSFIVGEVAMISTYARRSTAYAQRVTEANMLAEAVLEKSRNAAYTNLNKRFSALGGSPNPPIMFDLNRDGVVESYSETCTPDPPVAATVTVTCTCTAGVYTLTRTVTPYLPSAMVPFDSSTAADIGIVVGWTDSKGAAQQISIATVRAKF